MKKLSVALVILLICSILVIGCGSPEPTTTTPASTTAPTTTTAPAGTTGPAATTPGTEPTIPVAEGPQYGGVFRIIDPRAPSTTLGWFAEAGASGGIWSFPALEPLIRCTWQGEFSPFLATDWKVADDLKSITLTLREGVKFHDGSDFNAEVAKWNFDVMIEAKLGSYKEIDSVEALDDYTIRLNLNKYSNSILNTLGATYMLSKKAFDDHGKEWMRWNPVGTGPFKFVSFERDTSIKYTRFDGYWGVDDKGNKLPYLDGVEEYFISDPMTKSAAFEEGEADATGGDLTKMEYDLLQKNSAYYLESEYTGAVCLVPDSKNPDSPFANLKVREAIDYAIDREAIVDTRGFGFWKVTYQFANPDSASYAPGLEHRIYDPDKAKALLAEAGYPNGFQTKLIADNASTDKDAVVAIQGFLAEIGINAQIDYVDFATYSQYRTGGWNNAMLVGAVGFDANLNNSIERYWSQTAALFPSVAKSDEMQQMYLESRAAREYTPALMQKVLQHMHDNALVIPVYCITRGQVIQPYVHDTRMYDYQAWPGWDPARTWISK